ncbi:NADP-dependent oxidoreductase [Arthrobacter sp. MMS18-M83]|uniref:NADP-dependent oxidoreductase n=1 Tax=Arthrobacter sp. MMS18-M83 TaxID=2996261 RepID=UPI00227C4256|nr:NADP-dependent oxidoreductase [Arthrobacter sp. MMS18-M83]WAH97744.1 NADP-dependent oxidoreductase [Arthrobacter sp. MMS18-M83]
MSPMYAVQFDFPGGRETLSYREAPEPTLGAGEVMIGFEASSINPADLKISGGRIAPRAGTSPFTLGWDVAGIVDQVAPGVEGFRVGDRVIGMSTMASTGRGTWSQLVSLPATSLALAPTRIDPTVLAQLPLVGLTALKAVDELGPLPDQTVLVVGAAGAVGSCVVQLLARLGVEVHALVRTRERADALASEGQVTAVYTGEAPTSTFDAIIDAAGIDAAYALRPGGSYVTCVPGTLPESVGAGGSIGATAIVPESGANLATLLGFLADGSLSLGEPSVFRLSDIDAALTAFENRRARRTVLIA